MAAWPRGNGDAWGHRRPNGPPHWSGHRGSGARAAGRSEPGCRTADPLLAALIDAKVHALPECSGGRVGSFQRRAAPALAMTAWAMADRLDAAPAATRPVSGPKGDRT